MEFVNDDAQSTMDMIVSVQKRAKKAISASCTCEIIMLWGGIWFVGFLISHFLPNRAQWSWLVLDLIGFAGMGIIFGLNRSRFKAKNKESKKLGWRIFWFWFLLFIYADLLLMVVWPESGRLSTVQIMAFFCTFIMFAYVIFGLWINAGFMIMLGLAVSLLTIGGYWLLRDWFYLWMAVAAGGTMFVTGMYMRLKWR